MSTKNLFSDLFFQWAIFLFSYWAGGWGFLLGGQNIKKDTKVSFCNKLLLPHTTYNIFFWFLKFLRSKNKLYTLFKKQIKKNRYVSYVDLEKNFFINVSKLFFRKYLHFRHLTVTSLYDKRYQRYVVFLHSLRKIHWQHFFYVLKAAYDDSIFFVTLHFSASF